MKQHIKLNFSTDYDIWNIVSWKLQAKGSVDWFTGGANDSQSDLLLYTSSAVTKYDAV